MADSKTSLRRVLQRTRTALGRERAALLGEAVQRRVLDWDVYRHASAIALYAATDNEVATSAIHLDARRAGRDIFYPRLIPASARLQWVRVDDYAALRPGPLSILEPPGENPANLNDLASILIFVPGVAFSIDGNRLGRGGGHYDRMLAELGDRALSAGLAYSFQILDRLPVASHDWQLDFIITESAVHPAGAYAPAPGRGQAEQGGRPRWSG